MLSPTQSELDGLARDYNAGRFAEAAQTATTLAARYPKSFTVKNILGALLRELGRIQEAAAAFEEASELAPENPDPINNLGAVLIELERFSEAEKVLRRTLKLAPKLAEAHHNLGNALMGQRKVDAAISAYQRAVKLQPHVAENHLGLGNALRRQGKQSAAVACYQTALKVNPALVEGYYQMGMALSRLGQVKEAVQAFEKVRELDPSHGDATTNLANVLASEKQSEEAIRYYRDAIRIDAARARMLQQMRYICDWRSDEAQASIEELGVSGDAVPPFATLSLEDHPKRQMQRSVVYAEQTFKDQASRVQARSRRPRDRIRVGYFGADFHNHATMYLMAGLLREHDKSRFEITVFSYGRWKEGAYRKEAKSNVSRFFDIADMSDADVVDLARRQKLDIAIDLKGYTAETRVDLFQHSLAPVQISFLGYPGTLGAPFMDYMIADPVVISPEQRGFYTEKVIYMPHCYQPNDNTRIIAEEIGTRGAHNLPEEAFVLCCFNSTYKISPAEFDIWMRVLKENDNCALWLLNSRDRAKSNLRDEAEARGVDAERIYFADRASHAEHLARHRHADLFIDTFNYNAHTTASDALWSGLPIVTKAGQQFAARVAASLLTAVGLPELVAHSEADYEALIVELVQDRDRLAQLRRKLAENRLRAPLFDTTLYTRQLEKGFEAAHALRMKGEPASDIHVGDLM